MADLPSGLTAAQLDGRTVAVILTPKPTDGLDSFGTARMVYQDEEGVCTCPH